MINDVETGDPKTRILLEMEMMRYSRGGWKGWSIGTKTTGNNSLKSRDYFLVFDFYLELPRCIASA